ncbi:DUF3828 domain-containing protein [Intestinirhabdus alba]|jgi:hypothetical protein|uniref:DUF3828 domain-containing protein n=1 Tax=Intestinirhabdus alba TaxID=2899544 RepID=A0A6L6IQQ3_9ENTR|nr:DUF3828 domain-containing protein [Intestinirhabdus alba]MTH48294.1 DUF3828 domain-containing protein [Intestinirhabdus alba]
MKSLVARICNNFLYVLLFIFSQSGFCTELVTPTNTVVGFYKALLNSDTEKMSEVIEEYVSGNLLKSIQDSTICNYDTVISASDGETEKICSAKRECKEYKGNYICDWYGIGIETDVNYFTKSQDTYPSWRGSIKTSIVKQEEYESVIAVVLGEGEEVTSPLTVSLEKIDGQWKIKSVTD